MQALATLRLPNSKAAQLPPSAGWAPDIVHGLMVAHDGGTVDMLLHMARAQSVVLVGIARRSTLTLNIWNSRILFGLLAGRDVCARSGLSGSAERGAEARAEVRQRRGAGGRSATADARTRGRFFIHVFIACGRRKRSRDKAGPPRSNMRADRRSDLRVAQVGSRHGRERETDPRRARSRAGHRQTPHNDGEAGSDSDS